MAAHTQGQASDSSGHGGKLAGHDAQELLNYRVLNFAGTQQPIKHAAIFDRDDNRRLASNVKSFKLSTDEIVDIQDRISESSGPTGYKKDPIKLQGKEYELIKVGEDALIATSGTEHVIAALGGSMLLVITTESEDVDALKIMAKSFSEGLAN